MLCGEVITGVLELERAGDPGAEVMFGDAAARQQRLRVGEGPAPTIEADDALKLADRFISHRLAVEVGFAEFRELLAAASSLSLGCHGVQHRPVV